MEYKEKPRLQAGLLNGAQYRDRTCGLSHVKGALAIKRNIPRRRKALMFAFFGHCQHIANRGYFVVIFRYKSFIGIKIKDLLRCCLMNNPKSTKDKKSCRAVA